MSDSGLVGPGGAPLNTNGAKAVMGDDQLRAKQAAEEIRMILEAYDAELFPVMMLSPKGIIGVSVDIIPKQRPTIPMQPELKAVKQPENGDPDSKSDVDPIPADVIDAENEAKVEKLMTEEGATTDAELEKALTDDVSPDEGA